MAPPPLLHKRAAALMGLAGLLAYNWWIGATLAGLVPNPDGMFSDLEADGVPHALLFERLDIVSGLLICGGLVLNGAPATRPRLREWQLMLGFGITGVIGGLFPYACPEGRDDLCRDAEWHFTLPVHHYVHMVSGILEFACATLAIISMWRRLRPEPADGWHRLSSWLGAGLVIGYPALALSYLMDRWDAPVEAVFFMLFAGITAAAFLEPEAPPTTAGPPALPAIPETAS